MSVDGFVSTGPNDEQQWVTWAWEEISSDVLALADSADTILIGRKLAIDYIPYWESVYTNPEDEMYEVSKRVVNHKKVVFTQTLEKSEWNNTELATGDLVEEVNHLKKQEGKDIIVYGGSSFVANLVQAGLIDEFYLFINPVALGNGESVFSNLQDWQRFKLKQSTVYNCGIILMTYEKI
ncbi:dihydrofolate reductase family protein [Emticicia fontis]